MFNSLHRSWTYSMKSNESSFSRFFFFFSVTHLYMSLCPRSWPKLINRTSELLPSWDWEPLKSLFDIFKSQGTNIRINIYCSRFLVSFQLEFLVKPSSVNIFLQNLRFNISHCKCCSGQSGATAEVRKHFILFYLCSQFMDIYRVCVCFSRVIASVQRQMVMGDFTPGFSGKMQEFYSKLYFPADLKGMKNRCVYFN